MIYRVNNLNKDISIEDIDDRHMYLMMISLDELKKYYTQLHISRESILHCEDISLLNQNMIVSFHHYYYGIIHLINARDVFMKKDSFLFFIFQNMFIVVVLDDDDKHIENIFQTCCQYSADKETSLIRLVYYFLTELILKDYQYIEELQEDIENLEKDNIQETYSYTSQFKQLSQELLLLRNYYETLVSISEELEMNDYHIFVDDNMRYFEIFTRRLERLVKNVEILRGELHQLNEDYQSQIDYRLNKTMQFFTVVTTIFTPLTLITGWYGMNFENMPELSSPYGYYSVIIVSMTIIIVLVIWFKKKKYF